MKRLLPCPQGQAERDSRSAFHCFVNLFVRSLCFPWYVYRIVFSAVFSYSLRLRLERRELKGRLSYAVIEVHRQVSRCSSPDEEDGNHCRNLNRSSMSSLSWLTRQRGAVDDGPIRCCWIEVSRVLHDLRSLLPHSLCLLKDPLVIVMNAMKTGAL